MRVDVFPRQADLLPGQHVTVSVTVTNTSSVIAGYTLRVLGADPGWVRIDDEDLSLFPDEVRTVLLTVTPPKGLPAGDRRLAVQVRELTPPHDTEIAELMLSVPATRGVELRVDPVTVTGGRQASFGIIAANTGNTVIQGTISGADPEAQVEFDFDPAFVSLGPGEHTVLDMRTSARRRFIGPPAVRMLTLFLDDVTDPFFGDGGPPPPHEEQDALARATFVQRSVLSRGAVSLVGLLVAITVFATVLTIALSKLASQSTADRNLALQVAAARDAGASTTGTSQLAGKVTELTSGKPGSDVAVSVYSTASLTIPVATTATDSAGTWSVDKLPAGSYKISFRGAGFVELWYPVAAAAANARTITLTTGQHVSGVDATVGGIPATISGTVAGNDVGGATVYLEAAVHGLTTDSLPARRLSDPGGSGGTSGTDGTGASGAAGNPLPNNGKAILQSVPVGAGGTFTLDGVPSPSVYTLVVTKIGFADTTQQIDVGAGENRSDVQLTLTTGDGLISGKVSSGGHPLTGVTITASSGQNAVSTVSLSAPQAGDFDVRNLPTPGTYTLVASAGGYTTASQTITLTSGQHLTGVVVNLGHSNGTLTGQVSVTGSLADDQAGGVQVTATDGAHTFTTETESTGEAGVSSADVGRWTLSGVPIPGTYTITFSRSDLAAQTVSVSVDAQGQPQFPTPPPSTSSIPSAGATLQGDQIEVTMQSATAIVHGTVTQAGTDSCAGHARGEATVTLTSSSASYTVTSASLPTSSCGRYEIADIVPGTYTLTASVGTGTTPTSITLNLSAGEDLNRPVALAGAASVAGSVVDAHGKGVNGYLVELYPVSTYPYDPVQTTQTKDGGYYFADVAAGQYIVGAGPSSDPEVTEMIQVQPSRETHAPQLRVGS